MLADVIAEWTDWPAELQTITGYSWDEYRVLAGKLDGRNSEIEHDDELMLRQAAIQFFGYPNMTTKTVQASIGPDWPQALRSAFLENDQ